MMVWAIPLSTMELSPHSLTLPPEVLAFGVWLDKPARSRADPSSALPPVLYRERPALKLFRGEPAIPRLD